VTPPSFWFSDNVLARFLDPIGRIIGSITTHKIKSARPLRVNVPVICVGNLTVGGTGKTPIAASIAERLRQRGNRPAILLRGYGGKLKGPLKVDSRLHTFEDVGDEALLHAVTTPTWVSAKRALAALEAIKDGADVLVMDDGHQHPSLAKDLSLVSINGRIGFGNGRITPAGPLREPAESGLRRADAAIVMGGDPHQLSAGISKHTPILRAQLVPGPEAKYLKGEKVVAFAGIGDPINFFQALAGIGARVVSAHPFGDHYGYAGADIQTILDEAFSIGAVPITTMKDAVRLDPDQRQQVNVLSVDVEWEDPGALDKLLDRALESARVRT